MAERMREFAKIHKNELKICEGPGINIKKLMKANLIFIFMLLLFLTGFCSCNSGDGAGPVGTSRAQRKHAKEITVKNLELSITNADSESADCRGAAWILITIPSVHELGKPFVYPSIRDFWLRGKFDIEGLETQNPSRYYGIRLGLIPGDNAVYINNQLVGSIEFTKLDRWLRPSSYVFPDRLKLKEKNEIYAYFVTPRKHVSIISDILVQDKESYSRSQKWDNFLYNQLPMGFSILLLALLVLLIKNYFIEKNIKYLLYSFYLLNIIFSTLIIYSPLDFLSLNPFLVMIIIRALAPINALLIIMVFQSMYGVYLSKHNIIAASIIAMVSLYILTLFYIQHENESFYFVGSFLGAAFTIYMVYLIRRLNSLKPDRFKMNLIIIFLVFSSILSTARYWAVIYNIWYSYFYYIFTTPFYILFIFIHEVREARKKRSELESLYNNLKKSNNGLQTLTESAEKKLERVISFINENFTSDISREGLAAAVEMNPNYMGQLFHVYTGKKIKEHINHLRIREAARRLSEAGNGKRVIDIALAVGFESLATFNRAFKNIFNVTPTEYKKKPG